MTKLAPIVPTLLFALVVTQIIYVTLSNGGYDINRPVIWSAEALAFLAISVVSLAALAQGGQLALAWAAMAVSGVLNVVQVGIGIAMFGPLSDAGEAVAPVYQATVAAAFFLYFTGKLLFGFAAVVVGVALLRGSGFARVVGGLAALAGLAAFVVNLGGMASGMAIVFPAGATGTAATFLLAVALAIALRRPAEAG
jgi:hypothetical protein